MSCLSILVALAAVNVTNVTVPVAFGSLSSVHCARVVVPPLAVRVDSSGASVILNGTATTIDCDLLFADENVISVGLTLPAKASVRIDGNASGDCMPSGASVTACTMLPHVTLSSPNPLWDLVLSGIAGAINGAAPQLCADLALALNGTISNASTPRPETLPPLQPGQTDLRLWPLGRAIGEIVAALPVLFETLRIGCVVRADALGLSLQLLRDVDISDGASVALHIPAGFAVDVDVVLRGLVCGDGGFACTLDAHQPVSLENLKAINGGAFSYIMNYVALPEAESLINAVLVRNDSIRPSFFFSPADTSTTPDFVIAVCAAAGLAFLSTAIVGFLIVRHIKEHSSEPLEALRAVIDDAFIVIVAACTVYLFIWSNCTYAAVVYAGPIPIYSFSLVNTVTEMWKAGLYPLSTFVCLFSGVLPYIKLICIVYFAVLIRKPLHPVMRLIDSLGKLSFLDAFVLVILKAGLSVKGIAEVESQASYYIFVLATVLSIALGNFALHRPSVRTSHPACKVPPMPFNLAMSICVMAATILPTVLPTIRFRIGGLATLITADTHDVSLFHLFHDAGLPVLVLYLATVVVAPAAVVGAYPRLSVLGGWVAVDTLVLTCLSGLLQLDQSVAFILGPLHPAVYAAHASLRWPFYPALAAAVATAAYVALHVRPVRPPPTPPKVVDGDSLEGKGLLTEKAALPTGRVLGINRWSLARGR